MYKFIHFSDTHIGRKSPTEISKERVESSIKALEYCVDKAVEEDVDFVVHSGDFFDTVYPWHTVIDAAKEKIKPLADKGIPMYVIRGNHDRSFGQGRKLKGIAMEHLKNEYVKILDPSPHEFPQNGHIDVNEDIRVYGLGYHASRTPEILDDADFASDKFNILLLHDFVEGVTRKFSDNVVSADKISSKDLDYVGIGHDHEAVPRKVIDDVFFAAPGGTIDYDFNTTDCGKHYNIVEVDNREIVDVETGSVPQSLELMKLDFELEEVENREDVLESVEKSIEDGSGRSYALKLRFFGEVGEDGPSLSFSSVAESVEEHYESVLMCGVIDNTVLEGMNSYDIEGGGEQFNVDDYLSSHLDEDLGKNMVLLHEFADGMLGDEENLTSTGFNLNKEGRKKLKKKVEEVLFEE